MKNLPLLLILTLLLGISCTSKKKLAYLNNLPEAPSEQFFTMEIPDYKIQLQGSSLYNNQSNDT